MLSFLLSAAQSRPFSVLALCYVVYFLLRALYRVTLHPLARFPGPKLTAISYWYEMYWEAVVGGRFSQQIDLMHEKYGPIVRINPSEIHIIDPDFYDLLYNFEHHIDRPVTQLDNLQFSPTFEIHKMRRRAFDPYFSKPAVLKLEDVIHSNVDDLCDLFDKARGRGKPVSWSMLARCLTCEIICEYTFAKPYGFLKNPEASQGFFGAQNTIFKSIYLFRENFVAKKLFTTLAAIPPSLLPTNHLASTMAPFMKSMQERLRSAMRGSKSDPNKGSHRVLFEDFQSMELPASDKTEERQLDTVLLIVTAGFETTAYAMEQAIYHVLSNPDLLKSLKAELKQACPDPNEMASWTVLESLPLLSAVIQESLRMSVGVMSRLARINSKSSMTYGEWVIPKGTPVSLSIKDIHFNPKIFPDPMKFDPSRWMKGEESERLSKYLVSFSKGSRRCLGIHLAYAELYITLAAIFRRYELELFETSRRDVDPKLDYFIPMAEGENGVRVLVK